MKRPRCQLRHNGFIWCSHIFASCCVFKRQRNSDVWILAIHRRMVHTLELQCSNKHSKVYTLPDIAPLCFNSIKGSFISNLNWNFINYCSRFVLLFFFEKCFEIPFYVFRHSYTRDRDLVISPANIQIRKMIYILIKKEWPTIKTEIQTSNDYIAGNGNF